MTRLADSNQEAITADSKLGSHHASVHQFFTEPLEGRARELQQLQQILTTTLTGHRQLVVLEGDTGIGKTHLAVEFTEQARQRGVRVCVGLCQDTHQAVTYYPWQQILRDLVDLPHNRPAGLNLKERFSYQIAQLSSLIEEINPDWLIRLPLLGDLLGLPIPDNSTTAAFEPQTRQDALFGLVEELLQTWTQDQPLLLFFDDIQWMDEVSQALLLSLGRVQAEASVLFILAHTPLDSQPLIEALITELNHLPYVHFLILNNLSSPEVAKLLSRHVQGQVSDLAADLIQAQARGNPLFTKALVDAWRESKNLYQQADGVWAPSQAVVKALYQAECLVQEDDDRGQYRLAESAPLTAALPNLPDSSQSIVQTKLDRLPEPLKITLQTASIIGRRFEFDLLAAIHPARPNPTVLLKQLIQLQALDFIHQEKSHGSLVYLFKHNLVREAIYAALPEKQTRKLHRAMAEGLELWQPEAIELLAYHYCRSGRRDKTLFYLDQAADEAQRKYANETALDYYAQALAMEERWTWRRNQVRTLHILGRREEEKTNLQALGANLDTPTFQVGLLWGQYYEATSDYPKAQEAIELALADSRDKEDSVGEARSLSYLGLIARRQGNYRQARAWYRQAMVRFKKIPSLTEQEARWLIRVFIGLGTVYRQQGDFEQARECHLEALSLSRQYGNRSGEAQACNDLGVTAFYQRRLGEAITYQQQALEIWRAIGNRPDEVLSLHNLAQITHDTGDYDQAQSYLTESLRILRTTNNRWGEINALNDLGIFYQELGNWSKAEACLQQGLALAQEIGDQAGQAYILANLGLVARDKTQLEKAENLFTTGLVLARTQNDQYLASSLLNYMSTVSLETGHLEQAVNQAKSSLALRQELKMRFATPDNLVVLAASFLAMNEPTQALDWAARAEAILEECAGEGPEFPQQDFFIIHQVFAAVGELVRAETALQQAYKLVMDRANKISNRFLRQSFLERVTINRQIVNAYLALITGPARN